MNRAFQRRRSGVAEASFVAVPIAADRKAVGALAVDFPADGRDLVVQVPGHYGTARGTFALRSPARPNPIAISVAKLLKVEGNRLTVVGVDCLDNTALLDLKPYFASTAAATDAVVGWHAARKADTR